MKSLKAIKLSVLLMCLLLSYLTNAQDKLPFEQIPDAPDTYEAGNVVARMLDGLGYRFYWATDGLTDQELAYRPSPEARSTGETIAHIYGLTLTIRLAVEGKPAISDGSWMQWSGEKLRNETLENIRVARELLANQTPDDLARIRVLFGPDETAPNFPFWNLLNGPVADALYHTGQIVSFRRTAGHPMQNGVDVFMGITKREEQ